MSRLLQDDLPLAIVGKNSDNQVIKQEKTHWEEVQFRSIAEILVALQVKLVFYLPILKHSLIHLNVYCRFRVAKSYVQLNLLTQIGVGSTLDVLHTTNVPLGFLAIQLETCLKTTNHYGVAKNVTHMLKRLNQSKCQCIYVMKHEFVVLIMVSTNVLVKLIRYKLHLNVKDDSGSCKLMMLDTLASTIVDCDAVELWDGSFDEASIFSHNQMYLY